jgi:hypothetical protein
MFLSNNSKLLGGDENLKAICLLPASALRSWKSERCCFMFIREENVVPRLHTPKSYSLARCCHKLSANTHILLGNEFAALYAHISFFDA